MQKKFKFIIPTLIVLLATACSGTCDQAESLARDDCTIPFVLMMSELLSSNRNSSDTEKQASLSRFTAFLVIYQDCQQQAAEEGDACRANPINSIWAP